MKSEKFLFDARYVSEKRKYIDAINSESTTRSTGSAGRNR